MRKIKTIIFSILSIAIVAIFGFEAFAAVYVHLSIGGEVRYYTGEIGAKIWGTYSLNEGGTQGVAHYLNITGAGGTSTDNVYELTGYETDYSGITSNIGTTIFPNVDDELELYVFLKNVGDRYVIPTLDVTASDTEHISIETELYYFDISVADQIDPLEEKENASTASDFVDIVEEEIENERYSVFGSNSSIDNEDVWCAKVIISLHDVVGNISSSFLIRIGFMADVQYTSNDILSVFQDQNITNPSWTKFGYNATLYAAATKVEENSLSNLYTYLNDADVHGNANITYGEDDYDRAVVYKDIDLVNVDIATGEVIGKLSDVNYDFEWYGRKVTIAAGTTLASGRTLATDEEFDVDVYTYYPTMYIRRWVVGNTQWLSVSDKPFSGAVRIKEYYVGTFETTTFSPVVDSTTNDVIGYKAAVNSNGVITRSYVYDRIPFVNEGNKYLIDNYGYTYADTTYAEITKSIKQQQMMDWATNLTKAWKTSSLASQYKKAVGVQGENYTYYVYNALYLIKYANNDSQALVGRGNVSTFSAYNASGVKITKGNGNQVTTGGKEKDTRMEAEAGSGSIGVYNASQKGTATYTNIGTGGSANYVMSASGYNAAGMNYGYNSTYTYGNDKKGLYGHQFLTHSNGVTRKLRDGYVGSDGYTSVFCLGQCNPWGNVFKWIFGQLIVSDSTNIYSFISFNDYDYANASTSWYMSSNSSGYGDSLKTILTNRGYYELGYNIPVATRGYYRYLGTTVVDETCPQLMLIGMPVKGEGTASSTTGLTDAIYDQASTTNLLAVLSGGSTDNEDEAGRFFGRMIRGPADTYVSFGLRLQLIVS